MCRQPFILALVAPSFASTAESRDAQYDPAANAGLLLLRRGPNVVPSRPFGVMGGLCLALLLKDSMIRVALDTLILRWKEIGSSSRLGGARTTLFPSTV